VNGLEIIERVDPKTPADYVREEEAFVVDCRKDGETVFGWERPEFDNWRLWIEYLRRCVPQRKGTHSTQSWYYIAMELPNHISDGMPNLVTLGAKTGYSKNTLRKAVNILSGFGADFARLSEWPHPLAPPH
jgi:hypothetical protein